MECFINFLQAICLCVQIYQYYHYHDVISSHHDPEEEVRDGVEVLIAELSEMLACHCPKAGGDALRGRSEEEEQTCGSILAEYLEDEAKHGGPEGDPEEAVAPHHARPGKLSPPFPPGDLPSPEI